MVIFKALNIDINIMFEQIATNVAIEYPIRGPLLIEYGNILMEKFNGIKYFETRQSNYVWSLINFYDRKYWTLSFMEVSGSIVPHTDSGAKTVLNIYGQTNGGITRFYEPIKNEIDVKKIKNQTNGNIFKKQQLKEINSFIAKDKEAWLLDVSKIHAVELDPEKTRWAYCLSTQQPFSQARKQIAWLQ